MGYAIGQFPGQYLNQKLPLEKFLGGILATWSNTCVLTLCCFRFLCSCSFEILLSKKKHCSSYNDDYHGHFLQRIGKSCCVALCLCDMFTVTKFYRFYCIWCTSYNFSQYSTLEMLYHYYWWFTVYFGYHSNNVVP